MAKEDPYIATISTKNELNVSMQEYICVRSHQT